MWGRGGDDKGHTTKYFARSEGQIHVSAMPQKTVSCDFINSSRGKDESSLNVKKESMVYMIPRQNEGVPSHPLLSSMSR